MKTRMKKDGAAIRRAVVGLGKILLIAAITLLLLEIALRVRAGRPSVSYRLDLQSTVRAMPPPYTGDCGGRADATLGQLIRPSRVPDLLFELKPDLDTCFVGVRVRTNAEGLRAPVSFVRPKPPGVYRVLLLGDSQTFGNGVPYEQTFGALLETELGKRAHGGRVQVVNTGVPAYNTVQEAAYFAASGIAYQPDCVIILFIGNDLEIPDFLLEPDDGLAVNRSFAAGALGDLFWRLKRKVIGYDFEVRSSHLQRVPPEYRHLVGYDAYREALRSIAETARRDRIPVVDFADYVPSVFRRDRDAAAEMIDFQRGLGIRAPDFEFPSDRRFWLSETDHHLNPAGHAALALRLLEAISEGCPRIP
jgi:lysophospholipase L1-like esterase